MSACLILTFNGAFRIRGTEAPQIFDPKPVTEAPRLFGPDPVKSVISFSSPKLSIRFCS